MHSFSPENTFVNDRTAVATYNPYSIFPQAVRPSSKQYCVDVVASAATRRQQRTQTQHTPKTMQQPTNSASHR